MDEMDLATDREEIARSAAQAARKPEGPAYTGFCHHCTHPVPDPARWCCPGCRDDWERNEKAKRLAGK